MRAQRRRERAWRGSAAREARAREARPIDLSPSPLRSAAPIARARLTPRPSARSPPKQRRRTERRMKWTPEEERELMDMYTDGTDYSAHHAFDSEPAAPPAFRRAPPAHSAAHAAALALALALTSASPPSALQSCPRCSRPRASTCAATRRCARASTA